MRITAVMLALVATQAYADMAFKAEGIEMRLKEGKCTHPKVLALLKDEWVPRFRQGELIYQGKPLQMCWTVSRPGHIVIVDEDGDAAEVPQGVFKEVPTV
jgi:hypothetical protein